MKDTFGREIDYMRISVTDRCNLRCIYCMPEEGVESLPHSSILRFSEISRICRAAAGLGIRRLKVTGGEPLVRRGIVSLIRELKEIPGIEQVTMTTNGVLLGEMAEELAAAGLDAVTVSLDTLDAEGFCRITRRDSLAAVTESIEKVLEDGRIPLKINCVPLRTTPPEQLRRIALLAKENPVPVRFIEMMPIGLGKEFGCVPEEELLALLRPVTGPLAPCERRLGNGPARYFTAEGFAGELGFISAVSHTFCDGCNRVRLTSDGFLKSCLQYETGEDLRPALEEGTEEALRAAIERGIRKKPAHHAFGEHTRTEHTEEKGMSQIGG